MRLRLPVFLLSFLLASQIHLSASADEGGTLKLFILTGQSNAEGAVKGAPLDPSLLEAYRSSGVLFWYDNINKTSGASLGSSSSWGQAAPQNPVYNGSQCMGPEYGFSYMMEKKGWLTSGADNAAVVKVATDGGGNGYWLKTGTAYKAILSTVTEALAGLDRNRYSSVDISGLLYLQGESDTAAEGAQAGTRFAALMENLRADLDAAGYEGVTVTLDQSVLGQPSNGNASTARLKDYADTHENSAWVVTEDLKKWSGDNLHFSGASQMTIGARYAYNTALLQGLDVGTVRGQQDAALDTAAAWWGNGLEKLSATVAEWDLSSSNTTHRISDTAGTRLDMYGIRIADTYSEAGTVTIQGGYASGASVPSGADTTLAIGAGGVSVGGRLDNAASGSSLQYSRHLVIASNVELTADQVWTLSGGSSLTVKGAASDSSSAMGSNIISGAGNVSLERQDGTSGRAVFRLNQADHDGAGRIWTLGSGVDLYLNQSSSWANNSFRVDAGADASLTGFNTGAVTLGSLTLGDHSVFHLGGTGGLLDLSVNELLLGDGVSLGMDIRTSGADRLNNRGSAALNIDGLTFEFTYGSGVNASTRYVVMENVTGDLSSLIWNSQVSSTLTSRLELVDGNLVLVVSGSGSSSIVWPGYSSGCDALAANASTFNARAASGIASGEVSTRTSSVASGVNLAYYYANYKGYAGDVYGVLDGVAYTWAAGTGSGSSSEFSGNTLDGSVFLKVTGDYGNKTVNGTIFGAVNATVNKDVYVEADASHVTYGQNGSWGSLSGAYNSIISGKLEVLIQDGTFSQAVRAGGVGGTTAIAGGTSLTVNGGVFKGLVSGGGASGTIGNGVFLAINAGVFDGDVLGGGSGGTVNGGVSVVVAGGDFNGLLAAGGGGNTVNGDVSLVISGGDFSGSAGIYAGVSAQAGRITGNTAITLKDMDDTSDFASYTGVLSGGNQASGAAAVGGTRTLVLDHYTVSTAGMSLTDFDAISLVNGSATGMTWAQLNVASSVQVEKGSEIRINGTGKTGNNLSLETAGLFSGEGTVALTESGVYYVISSQLMASSGGDAGRTGLRLDGGTLTIREMFTGTAADAYANAFQVGDFSGSGHVSGAYGNQGSVPFRYIRATQTTDGTLVYSGIFENSSSNRSVGLVKDGVGTLVLTGNNLSVADLSVQGGVLQIGNGGTAGAWAGAIKVEDGGSLVWNRSDSVTRTDSLTVNGLLVQQGAGELTLAAATGTGILQAGSGSRLTVNDMSGFSGKVQADDNARVSVGGSWAMGDSSFKDTSVLNLLEGAQVTTGDYATYSNRVTLAGNGTVNVAQEAGFMQGVAAASGTLTKGGAGELSLYGTNEVQGLHMTSGSIKVVGAMTAGKLSGTGSLTVGGSLKVNAFDGYSGKITVEGGSVDLNGQGTLGGSSLTVAGGSVSHFSAASPTGILLALENGYSGASFNAVTGVTLTGAENRILSAGQTVSLTNGSSVTVGGGVIGLSQGQAAFLMDSSSSLVLSGSLTLDVSGWEITGSVLELRLVELLGDIARSGSGYNVSLGDDFALTLTSFPAEYSYDLDSLDCSQLAQTGSIYVNTLPVPEPGSVTLGFLGLAALLMRRRTGR